MKRLSLICCFLFVFLVACATTIDSRANASSEIKVDSDWTATLDEGYDSYVAEWQVDITAVPSTEYVTSSAFHPMSKSEYVIGDSVIRHYYLENNGSHEWTYIQTEAAHPFQFKGSGKNKPGFGWQVPLYTGQDVQPGSQFEWVIVKDGKAVHRNRLLIGETGDIYIL